MREGRCRVGWRPAAISPPAAGSRSTKKRPAIRRAFSIIGRRSAQRCAATADAYVRTLADARQVGLLHGAQRSEEHTSELQSLMRISYAVFCLKKKKNRTDNTSLI